MELILLKDVEKVGRKGELVEVQSGYARNFLLPLQLAMPAKSANKKFIEDQKTRAEKRQKQEKDTALAKSKELEQIGLTIKAAAGDQDKLFGSVTAEDLRAALFDQGFEIDKKRIHIKEPIRMLGIHAVIVELYPQVKATVKVEIIRKS